MDFLKKLHGEKSRVRIFDIFPIQVSWFPIDNFNDNSASPFGKPSDPNI